MDLAKVPLHKIKHFLVEVSADAGSRPLIRFGLLLEVLQRALEQEFEH
jgi:hypothetical protein